MEPARTIMQRLGGPKEVARILGTSAPAPYNWQKPKGARGSDGLIPVRYHRALIAAARERGVLLSAEDFLPVEITEGGER